MESEVPDTPKALPGDAVTGVTPVGEHAEIVNGKGQWVVWHRDYLTDDELWDYRCFKTLQEARHEYSWWIHHQWHRDEVMITLRYTDVE